MDATRVSGALAKLERSLESTLPSAAFLAGDGSVIYPVRERPIAAGVQKENIHLEAFFNNPERRDNLRRLLNLATHSICGGLPSWAVCAIRSRSRYWR